MRIEGHRGAGLMEPENTIKAFRRAIELEMDGIELDVWLTKDQVPVVIHGKDDGEVEFLNKIERIENMTLEDVKTTPLITGDFMPTLREVLEVCKDKICVNIELKGENKLVVEKTFELVFEMEMCDQISLSSFHHPYYEDVEVAIKKLQIQQRIYFGFLAHKLEEMPDFTKAKEDDSLNLDIQLLTTHRNVVMENIKKAKERKMRIKFYFPMRIMESDHFYDQLLEIETDTVITNYPLLLRDYLLKKEKSVNSPLMKHESEESTDVAKSISQDSEVSLSNVETKEEEKPVSVSVV